MQHGGVLRKKSPLSWPYGDFTLGLGYRLSRFTTIKAHDGSAGKQGVGQKSFEVQLTYREIVR